MRQVPEEVTEAIHAYTRATQEAGVASARGDRVPADACRVILGPHPRVPFDFGELRHKLGLSMNLEDVAGNVLAAGAQHERLPLEKLAEPRPCRRAGCPPR